MAAIESAIDFLFVLTQILFYTRMTVSNQCLDAHSVVLYEYESPF